MKPFEGESAEAILHRDQLEEAETPAAVRTEIPLQVKRTVLHSLDKGPDLRFQSAEDMMAALRLARQGSQESSSRPSNRSESPARTANARRNLVVRLALVGGVSSADQHDVIWRELDERGEPVDSGVYLYCVRATGSQ